jgi:predicted metallopeptidase
MALEFRAATDLQPIIDRIIELFYPLLQGACVRAVYRSTNFPDSPFTVARIEKITGLRSWLYSKTDGEQDPWFLIQIVVPNWEPLEPRQQIAVLDHEICHIDYNDETDSHRLRDHTVEEFPEIVERHGAYHWSLEHFYEAISRGEEDPSTRDEMLDRILNNG